MSTMLSKLLNLLFGRRDGTTFLDGSLLLDRHGEPFRQTAATATLTLLLEAARADHQVSSDELLEICRLLDQQFALRGEKARDLMATALEQQEEPQKAAQFLNILARRFDLEQRQHGMVTRFGGAIAIKDQVFVIGKLMLGKNIFITN